MRHKSAAFRAQSWPKIRDIYQMRNVGLGFGWWSVRERMTDGPKMGRRMIAKCEKGWKESSRAIKWVRGWICVRNGKKMSLRTGEERVGKFWDFINPTNVAGRARTKREPLTRGTAGGHSLKSRQRRTRKRQSSLKIE